MAMRGDGNIYKRSGSPYWWMRYSHAGVQYRESTKTTDERKAQKVRRERLKQVGADDLGLQTFIGPKHERTTINELLDDLEADYRLRAKNTSSFRSHIKPIKATFGQRTARSITARQLDDYLTARLALGKAPATINRETQLLNQAFRLGIERRLINTMPRIRKLPEDNTREGFFEREEFTTILNYLPEYLRDYARFAFFTGWRKGEISSLTWSDVEYKARLIHLRGRNSKNGQPRKVALEGALWEIIERRWNDRTITENDTVRIATHVFHRNGHPIGDIKKAWKAACNAAGVHRLFHDFRRTAVRNMIRAGVSEKVAMQISGHKTRSVFDRYNITDERDLRDAVQKVQAYLATH
jgi:integrase